MSDILSRLEAQSQDASNIAQRGQEMVQGFDNDRLMAQGQTLAYNMGKAQLSTLIGAETVAGLQHGVPVAYKTGKAIAQRLSGMPTTKEEAIARAQAAARDAAQKAGGQVAQRVESTAQPLVDNLTQETTSGAPGDFLKYDEQRGTLVKRDTGEEVGNDYFDSELQTPSGIRGDPALKAERLERLNNPPDPAPDQFRTVADRESFPDLGPRSFKAPTEAEFRAETEARRVAAQASDGSRLAPTEPIPAVAESEPSIGLRSVEGQSNQPSSYTRPGTSLRVKAKAPQLQPEAEAETPSSTELSNVRSVGNRFTDTGEPAPAPPPRDAPGGPDAPASTFNADDLFPAPPEQTTPLLPTQLFNPRQPSVEQPTNVGGDGDFEETTSFGGPSQDVQADIQSRLQNYRVQDGDGSGGGAQPNQQPEFKPDVPDKPTGAGVLDDIGKAELDTAPEQEIADAVPGLGEIIGGAIGLGSLIAGAFEGAEAPSKAPQQPAGIPAMQTAYDSAPVIDSDNYHTL